MQSGLLSPLEHSTGRQRPQVNQMLIHSMDSEFMNKNKIDQLVCRGNEHKPNRDVTRLLVNPEQALKKNLKPIKTAYGKDRAPLRSLFSVSSRNAH